MAVKEFQLKAENCKASLDVSDEELQHKGMINAKIVVDTKPTDFSKDMSIALKPKLGTMLFDTRDSKGELADGFFAFIRGDHLIISPLNQQVEASNLMICCKVNN